MIILSLLSVNVTPGNSLTNPKKENGVNVSSGFDLSMIASKGFVTSSKDDHQIQLGAFRLMSNESLSLYDTIHVSSVTPDTLRPLNFLSDTFHKTEKAAVAVRNIFFIKGDSPWLRRINYCCNDNFAGNHSS